MSIFSKSPSHPTEIGAPFSDSSSRDSSSRDSSSEFAAANPPHRRAKAAIAVALRAIAARLILSLTGTRPAATWRVPVVPETSEGEERPGETRDTELIVAVFRTLVLIVVLLGPRWLDRNSGLEGGEIWLAAVAGVYNIITGLGCLLPSRYGLRRPFIVAMDLLLISLWIQLSGQWELRPFYYIVVVVAAMWFRVLGGILTAAFCNFFFLYIWFRAAAEAAPEATRWPLLTTSIAIDSALLLGVGCLVGYIAESQERERERRLEDQLLIANYQREIDLSTRLQSSLIPLQWIEDNPIPSPSSAPLIPIAASDDAIARPQEALEIGAAMKSARVLGGGDYFDIIGLSDHRVALCIADVSGKSVRAQARLPLLKYSLRALAPLYLQPHALIERLNETLAPDLAPELYIAFCYVVLDPKRETLSWCNAGHIAPLLIDATQDEMHNAPQSTLRDIVDKIPLKSAQRAMRDSIVALDTDGPALGMFPGIAYETRTRPWPVGAQLLLFTDGLSDAFSYRGSEDGEAQVRKLAMRLRDQPTRDLRQAAREWVDLATAILDEESPLERAHSVLSQSPLKYGDVEPDAERRHRDDITVVIARHHQAV